MKNYRIQHILVPLDFSSISRHALHHAERIGAQTRARITLLHVIEPYFESLGGDAGVMMAATQLVHQLELRRQRQLEGIARNVMKRAGVKVRVVVAIGGIASTVRKKATETHADLIVMGTHGATGFVQNLMGSNTYRVATLSSIPVLSVHRPPGRRGYRNIVYPVRADAHSMRKVPAAALFAGLFNARVHIVGFYQEKGTAKARDSREMCLKVRKAFTRRGVETKTVFTSSPEFASGVIRHAGALAGALIVIRQADDFRLVDLFQGTFPKRILHKALSPVLTVPQ
jgi:nucleotide-binding universal stress UspA family protein